MIRSLCLLAVCGLVVATGCLGASTGQSATPTATSTLSARSVGERAVTALQTRIERNADEYENLTGLAFECLEPAEYEVRRRNGTGVVVRVNVGYSVSVDCDSDGEPDSSVDGANSRATYFVTETRVRLIAISRGILTPEEYC